MEEKNKQNNLQTYKKASLFKRFVCLLLVLSMMLSMTGCVYIDGQPVSLLEGAVYVIGGFLRAGTLILGDLAILCVTWVLDKITWPLYPVTGFNMDKPAGFLFRTWHRLIDPNKVHGDWSDMGEAEFHEEHPLTIWEKRKGETETDEDIQIQATTDPTQPTESHDKKGGIPNTGGNPPDGIPIIEDGQSIPKTGDDSSEDTKPSLGDTIKNVVDSVIQFADECGLIDTITISYDANGGYNTPEAHTVLKNGFQFLSKDVPVRPGYHFMGWSINPNDVITYHHPGKPYDSDTGLKAVSNTTLYAIWKAYSSTFEPEHKYTIEQLGDRVSSIEYRRSPLVRITCSCGLTITDKDLSLDEFRKLYVSFIDEPVKKPNENEIKRLYLLYLAQYVGPLALELNTSFYQDTTSADYYNLINSWFDTINARAISIDKTKILFASDYERYKHLLTGETKKIKGFICTLGDVTTKASTTVTILQAANAIQKMSDSEDGVLNQTIGMLDMIDCLCSLLSPKELKGLYLSELVRPITDTLRAGIKLIGKCAEYQEKYHERLHFAYAYAKGEKEAQYLDHVFAGSVVSTVIDELINGTPIGCHHSPTDEARSGCRFYSGAALRGAPTVYEIFSNMSSWPSLNSNWTIEDEEKEIILFYLAERSRHELFELTGLTLEQYVLLIDNKLPADEYAKLP